MVAAPIAPDHVALPRARTEWGTWPSSLSVALRDIPNLGRRVMLLESLIWIDPDGRVWRVPSGFLSDGATIPAAAWWLMGGRLALGYIRAAFLHDWLCYTRPKVPSSIMAAQMFHDGLRADGMSAWRATLCYQAVRWFGPGW